MASIASRWQRALLGGVGVVAYVLGLAWLIEAESLTPLLRSFGPSLGASLALLLFMPESPLGRPASVVAGHLTSAVCAIVLVQAAPRAPTMLLAALVLPAAALAMLAADCVHPPAGVTALSIVLVRPSIALPTLLLQLTALAGTMAAYRLVLDQLVEGLRRLRRRVQGGQGTARRSPTDEAIESRRAGDGVREPSAGPGDVRCAPRPRGDAG